MKQRIFAAILTAALVLGLALPVAAADTIIWYDGFTVTKGDDSYGGTWSGDTLTVASDLTIYDDKNYKVEGNLVVTGQLDNYSGGTLTVTGSLEVTGALHNGNTGRGTLSVGGDLIVGGALSNGDQDKGTLNVEGNLSVIDTLFNGCNSGDGTLTVKGDATVGAALYNGAFDGTGNLRVGGDLSVANHLFNGDSSAGKAVTSNLGTSGEGLIRCGGALTYGTLYAQSGNSSIVSSNRNGQTNEGSLTGGTGTGALTFWKNPGFVKPMVEPAYTSGASVMTAGCRVGVEQAAPWLLLKVTVSEAGLTEELVLVQGEDYSLYVSDTGGTIFALTNSGRERLKEAGAAKITLEFANCLVECRL